MAGAGGRKVAGTVHLTPEQRQNLKLLHQRTQVPTAVRIREAVDMLLQKHAARLPELVEATKAAQGGEEEAGKDGGG